MKKGANPSLFVNDGSFMERFRQLQQEKKEKAVVPEESKPVVSGGSSVVLKPGVIGNKRPLDIRISDSKKSNSPASNGKLAFSLKQKSKVLRPAVKLDEDEEEEREYAEPRAIDKSANRKKLATSDFSDSPTDQGGVAPSPPSDPAVRTVADKLASFVAKNGRQFEHVTCQRNPGDTPFKFLFDPSCPDYKYYEYWLLEEEKILAQEQAQAQIQPQMRGSQTPHASASNAATSRLSNVSPGLPAQHHTNYQTPASALYEPTENTRSYPASSVGSTSNGESSGPPAADPIAMMEYYVKKAAQEERRRPYKQSKDEMPPPASLQDSSKKGHHMGDYIPPDELEKFLATCNDAAAQKTAVAAQKVAAQKIAVAAAERAKIQADNIGHKLLSKMGWKEGEGLGSGKSGRADPVMAGNVKRDNLGVGAAEPGEVTPEDDIYDQYKKRMMLGYRYRPNPLKNPRKSYY